MANRWQMAKAFGRAMMEPIKAKDAGKVRDEVGAIAKKLDVGPREAYGEGVTEGFNDLGRAIWFEKKRKIPELRKRMDGLSDEATDKSLQNDFDEGFEASFNRAKGKFNEAMDKLGYTPEDKEQAYNRLRQLMIDKLKSGEPIQDVLDFGKNKYILIK